MKPLFIPLKSKHYEDFENGAKPEEFRLYGKRWNESTCLVGRDVVLSKGYGKKARLRGHVVAFTRPHAALIESHHHAAILDVYGTLDVDIARIKIAVAISQ